MSKYNTKVKILVPFIDGQKKGDINYMKKDEAERYQKEGLVKIFEEPKKEATISRKNSENKKKTTSNEQTHSKSKYNTKVEIIIPFNEGQKKGDIRYMDKKGAELYQKEGLVKILEEPKKEATISRKNSENNKKTTSNDETPIKEKKSSQNSSNELEDLDYFDSNMRELLFKKYNIYSIQSEKDELFIFENIKTNVINTYKKNKLFNELKRELYEFKGVLYSKKINEFMDFLITQNLIKSVYDVGFKPTQEKIFTHEKKTFLNSYTSTPYLVKSNFKTYEGDYREYLEKYAPNIYYLICNLCGFNEEHINYLIQWLSSKIQRPYKKLQKGIVFYGDASSGKGLFYDTILKKIFSEEHAKLKNMKSIDPNKNESNYNQWESKLLISVIDECYYLSSIEDILKSKHTQPTKTINKKGGNQWEEVCYEDTFYFSNRELPIKIGDRRISYFKTKTLKGSKEKSNDWYYNDYMPNYERELKYLLNVLHNISINELLISNNIENDEIKEIRDLTKSLEEKFISFINEFDTLDDIERYLKPYQKTYNEIVLSNFSNCKKYFSLEGIYNLYDLYLKYIDYKKVAVNKNQLLKLFEIDINDKSDYKRLWINKRRQYCISVKKIKSKLNQEKDEEEEKTNNYNYNTNEIMEEVK